MKRKISFVFFLSIRFGPISEYISEYIYFDSFHTLLACQKTFTLKDKWKSMKIYHNFPLTYTYEYIYHSIVLQKYILSLPSTYYIPVSWYWMWFNIFVITFPLINLPTYCRTSHNSFFVTTLFRFLINLIIFLTAITLF